MAELVDLPIAIPYDAVADFCRRNHIRRLSLFGSVLRDDFGPDSDIDVLAEFEPGHTPGLAFFDLGDEFAEILGTGRPVQFLTAGFLNHHIRDRVVSEARALYDAT